MPVYDLAARLTDLDTLRDTERRIAHWEQLLAGDGLTDADVVRAGRMLGRAVCERERLKAALREGEVGRC